MPWLYFEDWKGNLPLGKTAIKVFAANDNPRHIFSNPSLFTLEMDGSAFVADANYTFEERGSFNGALLESFLESRGLDESTRKNARAMFRFSHMHGLVNNAMAFKRNDKFVIDHPMQVINWRSYARTMPFMLHMDIVLRHSLAVLKTVLDYEDESLLVVSQWGSRWRLTQRS